MLENLTFLNISYSTCPTVNVNTHLSCLIYGRVPTKGRNYVGICVFCNYSDFINISKHLLRGKQTMMSRKENEINKYTKVPRTIK